MQQFMFKSIKNRPSRNLLKQGICARTCGTTPGLFDIDEIILGERIESGRYCHVYEIKEFKQNHVSKCMMAQCTRDYMTKHVTRADEARYVIKFIKKEFMRSHKTFEKAAVHLSTDIDLMTTLNHKNIMRIKGLSTNGSEEYYNTGRHDAYFVILERLDETLDHRMKKWCRRAIRIKRSKPLRRLFNQQYLEEKHFLSERLQVAYEIAEALEYMHSHDIAFGHFTSESVGFNKRGSVQLYDLGDAAHVPFNGKIANEGPVPDRMHHFIAPEVMLGKGYSAKADVYSFSTLLCEIVLVSGDKERRSQAREAAVNLRRLRKIAGKEACAKMVDLLQRGWALKPEKRPSMKEIREAIKTTMHLLSVEGKGEPLVHCRRERMTQLFSPEQECCETESTDLGASYSESFTCIHESQQPCLSHDEEL